MLSSKVDNIFVTILPLQMLGWVHHITLVVHILLSIVTSAEKFLIQNTLPSIAQLTSRSLISCHHSNMDSTISNDNNSQLDLSNKTIGFVGCGKISSAVCRYALYLSYGW